MIYSQEVEMMCPVAQGANHGPAPIPEEAKWVQAKDCLLYTSSLKFFVRERKERDNQKMERFICLLIGYAFGLIQTGYIYGKMRGVDIRKEGSGNAGSTNACLLYTSRCV